MGEPTEREVKGNEERRPAVPSRKHERHGRPTNHAPGYRRSGKVDGRGLPPLKAHSNPAGGKESKDGIGVHVGVQ
jgi:hypothetical protein